ncbi:hypothetical protein F5X68DRAFT_232 [Plectosphaerella plurivora]|uniref:Uncharacterized protein n=1 Tax=Plectosphaerella plurivora TaxID=936078 RepID=A0A9P9AGQ0_9PEZI|nr:hypothetical protein F5X68DRAFT_232 [Plectosphaerella plurivora]
MSLNTPTPPLLLTKRLTSFLNANLSSSLNAAFLSTPSGKLLAHATTPGALSSLQSTGSSSSLVSPTTTVPPTEEGANTTQPSRPGSVTLLRTQATVAASLYALHSAASPAIPDALPEDRTPGKKQQKKSPTKPLTITVQLSHGVMVIRRLKCGLLFVCIGPLGDAADSAAQHLGQAGGGGHSEGSGANNGGLSVPGMTTPRGHGHASPSHMPASPSGDSVMSVGGVTTASIASAGSSVAGSIGTAAVVSLRRHAEDLARWLDDKLGTLRVPEEGVGVE